jgi:quercetin dioxygenase-like cupin family protein
MSTERKYVINVSEAESYSPPRHKGTINYRLSGKSGLGSENFEILMGVLKKGSEAEYHLHKKSEQAIFVIDGSCLLEFSDGTKESAKENDLIYMPTNLAHRLSVVSEDFKALVIYSPRLEEGDMIPFEQG